jgi:NAD(P)-dependent dehydrogenase (short-subunit alcohol dehydrogenase family)
MSEKIDLSGQVALVTGGGRGLGRAFAQALARAGAAVSVIARSEDQLAETVRLIQGAGGRAIAIPADVTDRDAVEGAVATIERRLGSVDLLANNAGVYAPVGPAWEVDPDRWWRTIEVNLLGPFLCARAVLPGMVARRRGRIINISSGAAAVQYPYGSAYGISKAALTFMTNSLAAETKGYGVSVFSYVPGTVRTAMSEHLAESPEVHRWIGYRFRKKFEEGSDTPVEEAVRVFMILASGRADALSGRHISVSDDVAELVRRVEEIEKNDLYTLRLRT